MATKKQKRAAGIAKREVFEAEQRERGMHFLKLSQEEHRANKEKAETVRKERAIAKSKRLAAEHQRKKEGVATYKPAEKDVIKVLRPKVERPEKGVFNREKAV